MEIQNQEVQPIKKQGISTVVGIIIIIAVALILFGGVFAYQYFFVKPQPIVQTPQAQANQTAGWKTYTNSEYGFEFKYPKNLFDEIIPATYSSCAAAKQKPRIQLFFGDYDQGLDVNVMHIDILCDPLLSQDPQNKEITVTNIGGHRAEQYSYTTDNTTSGLGGNRANKVTVMPFDNYSVEISFSSGYDVSNRPKIVENANLMSQILATFKFVAPVASVAQTSAYLVIKEFGLKFKVTNDIKDLIYKIEEAGDGVKNIYLSSVSLAVEKGCNFDPAVKGPLGEIIVSGHSLAFADGRAPGSILLQQNKIYIYYVTSQSICSAVSSINQLQTKQLQSVKEAVKTISQISQDVTPPTQIGQCVKTTVSEIGNRLEGYAGSGSFIKYTDDIQQVSYETIQGIENSSVGDEVNLCLISLPKDCPPGDNRGKIYGGTNLRTGQKWEASDSAHSCGGA